LIFFHLKKKQKKMFFPPFQVESEAYIFPLPRVREFSHGALRQDCGETASHEAQYRKKL
jgi:hypothetical protein